jgi:SAM-dependent methyltransferase
MSYWFLKHKDAILDSLGIHLPKGARILDFGCGAGKTVYSLRDQGYCNTVGYDMKDYLELRQPADRSYFYIADFSSNGKLPFEDNSFDFVISEQVLEHVNNQVGIMKELHRIMRPGGHALHIFPARYCIIEPHIYVPFGGVIGHRWWYKFWALLGIRNEYQKELTADETADRNAFYFIDGLNYAPNSCYQVIWKQLGYEYKWIDQETFDTHEHTVVRMIGKLNLALPLIGWISRTFFTRQVLLRKKGYPFSNNEHVS